MPNELSDPQRNENSDDTLSSKWPEIKVLEATLTSTNTKIKKADQALVRAEGKLKALQDDIRTLGKQKVKVLADLSTVKRRLDESVKDYHEKIDSLKFETRGVEQEIKDRRKYYDDQEKLINESSERGNEELKIIKYQLEDLQRVKQEFENQVFEAKQRLENLDANLKQAQEFYTAQIKTLLQKYDESVAKLEIANSVGGGGRPYEYDDGNGHLAK